MAVSLQEAYFIRVDGQAKAWSPQVETIDGRKYVLLDPYQDKGFSQFVWGDKRWKRSTGLNELKTVRMDAIKEAVLQTEGGGASNVGGNLGQFRHESSYKKRLGAKRMSVLMDNFLSETSAMPIKYPAVPELGLCETVVWTSFRKDKCSARDALCIEATVEGLQYMRTFFRGRVTDQKRKADEPSPGKGIYWHRSRKGWVVDHGRAKVSVPSSSGLARKKTKTRFFCGKSAAIRYTEGGDTIESDSDSHYEAPENGVVVDEGEPSQTPERNVEFDEGEHAEVCQNDLD